ncbi:D-alanyl-lipoteichoic acid acyltransferase DltB, MBOAT superfamily [Lachnospiraceae bacterium G11]|nr:D-alanyl-lipoteichoic acid acyltransferase DltB, MBOAT superfamily [Lachnospiraceae bacterium G11]
MLFNSYIFVLLFLPVVVLGYWQLNRLKSELWSKLWLIVSSLIFYGYYSLKCLGILCLAILINYALTSIMTQSGESKAATKACFAGTIIFNIGILVYFKYTVFIIDNINRIGNKGIAVPEIVLPLGISFYVFGQLAYAVDVYKGRSKAVSLIDYVAYMTFFPKISQGPIQLCDDFEEQVNSKERRAINYENILKGFYLFSLGLGKKVLLADNIAKIVNEGFANFDNYNSIEIAITMICYSLQIYLDFSGYCDMASGIGKMLNIELPINFNSPYKANSIADFWQRWHMTLNQFFTKYIYIPLGGSRSGKFRTVINVMIVFAISGIWHGANWTFVVWGLLNGLFVVIYRLGRKWIDKIPNGIRIPITFAITTLLWSIFRSDNLTVSWAMIKRLFTAGLTNCNASLFCDFNTITEIRIISRLGLQGAIDVVPWFLTVVVLSTCLIIILFTENSTERIARFKPTWKKCSAFVVIMTWGILSMSQVTEFIYFNF